MAQSSERPAGRHPHGPSNFDQRRSDRVEDRPQGAGDQFPIVIARLDKNRREQLRVALDRYQGINLLDLRVTVDLTEASGVQTPTKKGISIQVRQLPALLDALHQAEARARQLGLIHEGD